MKEDIQKIIEANLPKQVGEALQKRLSELESKEEQLLKANEFISKQTIEIAELKDLKLAKENLDKQYETLELKLIALAEEKRNLKVEKLEFQLASERDKTQFSKDIALGLVRNTVYRNNMFDSESGPDGTDEYGNIRYTTQTKNVTEEKTQE